MSSVLSVIQNWRRPDNVSRIVEAIRAQTVNSYLAIVDCAAGTEWEVRPDAVKNADAVFSIRGPNLGPCCRFIPSMLMPEHESTLFFVDDYLPGDRCVEYMEHVWKTVRDQTATVGQDGRVIDFGSGEIIRKRVKPGPAMWLDADVITTTEICRTEDVRHFAALRDELLTADPSVSVFEDDLLLCLGIARARNVRCKVIGVPDERASWRVKQLPAPNALCARPDHQERRDKFIRVYNSLSSATV